MRQPIHRATVGLLLFAVVWSPAPAQQDDASVAAKIRQVQSLVAAEFRQILAEEMMLTEAERKTFWPLYERYSAESRVISDRYLEVVTEFVERYHGGELSDEDASRLLDAYFERRLALLQLRRSYVPRFREVLSGLKVTRFYQLQNRVQAEVDAAFAAAIPLAEGR